MEQTGTKKSKTILYIVLGAVAVFVGGVFFMGATKSQALRKKIISFLETGNMSELNINTVKTEISTMNEHELTVVYNTLQAYKSGAVLFISYWLNLPAADKQLITSTTLNVLVGNANKQVQQSDDSFSNFDNLEFRG